MVETGAPRILIVGGGYVGMYTALRLQRQLRGELKATADRSCRRPALVHDLPAVPARGGRRQRRAAARRRAAAHGCCARCRGRSPARVTARRPRRARSHGRSRCDGEPYELTYDQLVVAPGSVARTLPIPGLAEQGIGFKKVEEAIALRNQVLEQLDIAASSTDAALRRRALTFVFVGGGYAGIEALAELEDMARYATRYYPQVAADDLRFVLVEATGRILPEVGEDMGATRWSSCASAASRSGSNTRLESCVDGHVVLSDGDEFDAETLVWTAGVKANPMVAETDLPLDDKGRLRVHAPTCGSTGVDDAWAAGDCAAVPDLTSSPGDVLQPERAARRAPGQAPRRQHRRRHCAARQTAHYKHKHVGSVASLGLHKGVAQVYGIKLKGWPAWFMHRTYHVSRVPTFNRKVRVVADWTLALFFQREVVSLGRLQTPRQEFTESAAPPEPSSTRADGRGVTLLAVTVIGHDRPGIIADVTGRLPPGRQPRGLDDDVAARSLRDDAAGRRGRVPGGRRGRARPHDRGRSPAGLGARGDRRARCRPATAAATS